MRKPRIKIEGASAVYHCVSRIVGGEHLLGDAEKEKLRLLFRDHARFCGAEVITHCVMSNHFHLLVRFPEDHSVSDKELVVRVRRFYRKGDPFRQLIEEDFQDFGKLSRHLRERLAARMGDVSQFMKELKLSFSKWFNKRHKRYGALWSARFKSVVIEDAPSVVATVAGYIDLNPIRAGIVDDPKDYRWCGYAEAVAGDAEARRGIESFHPKVRWAAVAAYRKYLFVRSGASGSSEKRSLSRREILKAVESGGELDVPEILRLRIRYFTDGVAIGSREFVDGVFAGFRDRFSERRKSGARRLGHRGAFSDLCSLRNLRVSAIE